MVMFNHWLNMLKASVTTATVMKLSKPGDTDMAKKKSVLNLSM